MMKHSLQPRIYVACLASYNAGILHGRWINALQEVDSIYAGIREMLADSPTPNAEEWAIHDYEDFGSLEIEEYSGVESVHEMACFIQEYGELGVAAMEYYGDLENAVEALMDYYHGEWENELEFATELFDELYAAEIPEHLRFYINYDQFSYDIFINDYLSLEVNGKVHVISQH